MGYFNTITKGFFYKGVFKQRTPLQMGYFNAVTKGIFCKGVLSKEHRCKWTILVVHFPTFSQIFRDSWKEVICVWTLQDCAQWSIVPQKHCVGMTAMDGLDYGMTSVQYSPSSVRCLFPRPILFSLSLVFGAHKLLKVNLVLRGLVTPDISCVQVWHCTSASAHPCWMTTRWSAMICATVSPNPSDKENTLCG